jgi:hypothetical protein
MRAPGIANFDEVLNVGTPAAEQINEARRLSRRTYRMLYGLALNRFKQLPT